VAAKKDEVERLRQWLHDLDFILTLMRGIGLDDGRLRYPWLGSAKGLDDMVNLASLWVRRALDGECHNDDLMGRMVADLEAMKGRQPRLPSARMDVSPGDV